MPSTDHHPSTLHLLASEWIVAGCSNGLASGILNPLDVSKTRMQAVKSTNYLYGLSNTFKVLYLEGGVTGLWKPGLYASLTREMLYSGPRAGFYVPIRNNLMNIFNWSSEESLTIKVCAALITGTLGSIVANPIDVIKVRMMVDPKLYSSILNGLKTIYFNEGFSGLYKGLAPSTLRGAFIAVGELATYDHSKTIFKTSFGFNEGFQLHAISSLITGIIAATVAAPFDFLKTRAMNNLTNSVNLSGLILKSIREEGLKVLFRGWLPAYLRLGPHALICFPIFEQMRKLFNLDFI